MKIIKNIEINPNDQDIKKIYLPYFRVFKQKSPGIDELDRVLIRALNALFKTSNSKMAHMAVINEDSIPVHIAKSFIAGHMKAIKLKIVSKYDPDFRYFKHYGVVLQAYYFYQTEITRRDWIPESMTAEIEGELLSIYMEESKRMPIWPVFFKHYSRNILLDTIYDD